MAEPNWELWGSILEGLQGEMREVRSTLAQHGAKLDTIEKDVRGLKSMAQMALGTASGADFVAERAEKLASDTHKRLDQLIEALKRQDIHVDA